MKFVKKTACWDKKQFLSEVNKFFNTNVIRKLVDEKKIVIREESKNKQNLKERHKYEIKGKRRGKIGKIVFTTVPPSLLPNSSFKDHDTFKCLNSYLGAAKSYFNKGNNQLWIAEFVLKENITEILVLTLKHFLLTRKKRMQNFDTVHF